MSDHVKQIEEALAALILMTLYVGKSWSSDVLNWAEDHLPDCGPEEAVERVVSGKGGAR